MARISCDYIPYIVRDIENKITIKFAVFYYGGDVHSYHNGSDEFSWLTSDELDAIHEALIRSHKKKSSRMKSIREARHKRQREKYKEIYCESDR